MGENSKIQRNRSFKAYIYTNKLDKACFAHDAAYSDSNDLAKRNILDKILKESTYEIATNPKYYGYQKGLASMVYKFFDKKTGSRAGGSVSEELAQNNFTLALCKMIR